ncbi:MAG: stage V sporulation protein AD [Anaeroplasmataceae bacterium]
MRHGKRSIIFKSVYLIDTYTVCGPLEYEGPLGSYFDKNYDDLALDEKSFEKAEICMQHDVVDGIKSKLCLIDNDIDVAMSGDLVNQDIISHYTFRDYEIPFIGLYGACSNSMLVTINASIYIDSNNANMVLGVTSSHNLTSERQFRNPVEYGGAKKESQTFTVTGACSFILSNESSKIKVIGATIGRIIDVGFNDALDMGRAMAPAAIETLFDFFNDFKMTPNDIDLILTGDLSHYGSEIVYKALVEKYGVIKNYNDCGNLIYRKNQSNVIMAGGSGCAAMGIVGYGYVYKEMLKGNYNRVLLCSTGALMNSDIMLQRESIPCIAHAVLFEVVK